MPTFMTNFVYTGESWQKLASRPEDRSVPVKALMEKLGGRLISMYYMAGDYPESVRFGDLTRFKASYVISKDAKARLPSLTASVKRRFTPAQCFRGVSGVPSARRAWTAR